MKKQDLQEIIGEAARERGVTPAIIVQALEAGVSLAAQKKARMGNLRAQFNIENGEFSLWQVKTAKSVVIDEATEISLEDAKEYDRMAFLGADVAVPFEYPNLGSLAATTTRRVMQKNMKEMENEQKVAEMAKDTGKMQIGSVIGKSEKDDYLLKVGEELAVLPREEQAFREIFENGEVVKVIVVGADVGNTGPLYIVSRTHPLLLRHLLAREIPEVADGVVVVRALARDTAGRAKIAVDTANPDVDPVGTCIGPAGSRVQNIIRELKGENIDIIRWSDNPEKLIAEALKPGKVKSVRCNPDTNQAWVALEADQQPLAVGKKGLNIRLASRLTHWSINIL